MTSKELKVIEQELMDVYENEKGERIVGGRELHAFLEVKTNYSTWFERMTEYGFIENTDYILLSNFEKQNGSGGHNKTDHAIKLDMAKEISMIQRNEKGKQARQYFIKIEKKYQQLNQPKSQSEIILMLAQQNVDIERKQLEIENTQKQHQIELDTIKTKQDNIVEIVSLTSNDWRDKIKAVLKSIAKNKGGNNEYKNVYVESYKALEERAKCKLNIRLLNRKKDLAVSGASKSTQDKLTKLDVIAEDKRLTEIYLSVIKDMAIKYSVNMKEVN